MNKSRCSWGEKSEIYKDYHDREWGIPVHDDVKLFEFLTLESFQSGLSWITILKKRNNFINAFDGFNPDKIADYNKKDVERLMKNSGIVRNLRKINACINNAGYFLEIQKEFGSFDKYIWAFVNFKPIVNCWESLDQLPAKTDLSNKISMDLKNRGFKFIGSTVMYSHMQAIGMVNDHLVSCFRYNELKNI